MTALTIDELLVLGQLAGYTRAEVAKKLLDADDSQAPITPSSTSMEAQS